MKQENLAKVGMRLILLGMSLIFFSSTNVFGLIWANYSPIVFSQESGKRVVIESMVTEGAGQFLSAYADVMLLLNKVELSEVRGIDNNELRQIVNHAAAELEMARGTYSSLVLSTGNVSYNKGYIKKLQSFDYEKFMNKGGLNSPVFIVLKNHLKKGDIRGFYAGLLNDIDGLLDMLYGIKSGIDAGKLPVINDLWKLNDRFIHTLLLGQYGAQVFHSIK